MELKQIAYLSDTLVLNKTTTQRLAHDAAKEACCPLAALLLGFIVIGVVVSF
ncbi:hypothetical protein UMZ34_21835 [Halopseudomonas pachastrellae]|nr:hypothetical protein UMZ34_21835 [Halopseudomonas pachastrellae]